MNFPVANEQVKSIIMGLTMAHVCLGVAAVAALTTVIVVGWTQLPFLVSWVPAIFVVVFLVVTTMLLKKDMSAQQRLKNKDR
jgi:type IV secretory pathway VirB3-like protein